MAHKKKKRGRIQPEQVNLGFQIAPMIDIVFVIMLFFMVQAASVQVEQELNLKLPGTIAPDGPVDVIEETQVQVLETGEVLLNDDLIGPPEDMKLNSLANTMYKLDESAKAAGSKTVVTIVAEEYAPYQRIIDVLNALSRVRIQNVTFEVPPQ
jgi:biopolymer transport protein ExbD